jgi:hypothetical protein
MAKVLLACYLGVTFKTVLNIITMYKFTYYLREGENLRQVTECVLNSFEDAVKYQFPFNASLRMTQEGFDRGFTHSEEHPCTLKQGEVLRLRITKLK